MDQQITITRALAELKLLDSRIRKEIETAKFADIYQNRNKRALLSNDSIENFQKKAQSQFDSISALITRRNKIKAEIVKSNANTIVKIGSVEYTVAEAIDRKSSIEYEKLFLTKLRRDRDDVNVRIEKTRADLDSKVQVMLEQNLGADKKVDKDAYDNIAKPFIEANEFNLIDPLNIKTLIETKDKEIDEFLSEVDFVLSESNSKTMITA